MSSWLVWLHGAFNVLLSAAFSFLGGAVLVTLAALVLRIRDGRARLALVLAPFLKTAYELARGVPADGFFWLRMQDGARQELGGLRCGFGATSFGPVLDLSLSARYRGAFHPQSGADLVAAALSRRLAPHLPAVVAAVALLGALALLAVFVLRLARVERRAAVDATTLETRRIGLRRVAILASAAWTGAPFAAGLLRPAVVLPAHLVPQLAAEERDAVIAHELAHLRGLHLVVVLLVGVVERVLWFVPGTGVLAREARALCEVCADDAAVRGGVERAVLASALVRVAELARRQELAPTPTLALFERAPVLARRVRRLLDEPPPSAVAPTVARLVGVALVVATVLRATTLGNP